MATILITGGTGMIGTALTKTLIEKDHDVIILTRHIPAASASRIPRPASGIANPASCISYAEWNIEKQFIDPEAFSKADYIIHLAGANVGEKRWTKKRKKEIVESRTKSGYLLVKSLQELPNKIKGVFCSSATGWYGPDPLSGKKEKGFTEGDPPADDFLGRTCQQWERTLEPVKRLNKRLVIFRTGPVMNFGGGMLKEFMKPVRFGIAPILGSGQQMISWIHIDDLVRIYVEAIANEQLSGVYNAIATHPVSNKELILALARAKLGKFFIPVPVPAFLLKFFLGEMSEEVLKSTTVSNEKIRQTGFIFHYRDSKALEKYFEK